jgi:nucleoside-diphosphate-sugar epimerase
MRVFLTGATGFIGSAIVPELINAGHQVLGLTRSEAGAQSLKAAGAEVHRGNLEDLESLRSGASKSDGVIHTAFNHDFSKFVENCENDRRAIEAMGDVLAGSDRPLLITSGTGMGNAVPGQPATEDHFNLNHPNPRKASEVAGVAVAERGVNVSVVRLPQVHDTVKQGLITYVVPMAREKGVSAYIGDGLNRWPAAHVLDVARLYRLALEKETEKHKAGSRYNAVAEEGVSMREIAEVIGRGLKVPVVSLSPEEASAHFGWLAMFAGFDMPASSAQTQQRLGWRPTGPGLISDLEQMQYFEA